MNFLGDEVSKLQQLFNLVFNVVGYFFSQFLQTVVACLIRHQSRKIVKELLQENILFIVFEFVKLGVVNNVALDIFETLLYLLLDNRLIATL